MPVGNELFKLIIECYADRNCMCHIKSTDPLILCIWLPIINRSILVTHREYYVLLGWVPLGLGLVVEDEPLGLSCESPFHSV